MHPFASLLRDKMSPHFEPTRPPPPMLLPTDFTDSRLGRQYLMSASNCAAIRPSMRYCTNARSIGCAAEAAFCILGRPGELGGASDCCRLRIYRYPNGPHAAEINRRTRLIVDSGVQVTFHWKHMPSGDDALIEETRLLQMYGKEHHELPPFNGRK